MSIAGQVRLGCYAMLGYFPSPWCVLPVETLNGITFGCAWAAGTVNCSQISPLGLEATTQAMFSVSPFLSRLAATVYTFRNTPRLLTTSDWC